MAGGNAGRKLGGQGAAFLLMMVPSIGLYLTMGQGQDVLLWGLLGMVATGMLLAVLVS